MGTRSSVGAPAGDGIKGRYVHWDGYPSGVGTQLLKLVQRDGLERVLDVLTVQHYGWSNLDADQADTPLRSGYDDGRFVNVPGYGIAYTTHQGQSDPSQWVTESEDWGTEWAYVLRPTELVVLENTYTAGGSSAFLVRNRVPYTAAGITDDHLVLDAAGS